MRSGLALVLAGFVVAPVWAQTQVSSALNFDVKQFAITGANRVAPAVAEAAVLPYVGRQRDMVDVQAARIALESVHHALGYTNIVVRLPQQEYKRGKITLEVITANDDVQAAALAKEAAAPPPLAPAAATPAADGVVKFDIGSYAVEGNTLLPADVVAAALAPFVGKDRDFGDVQRALESLEAVYHSLGYNVVSVELPEQDLNNGVVKLNVLQSRIGRVTVEGNQFFDEANIRRSLPDLQENTAPNIKRISAGIKLANDNAAKKVTMKLQSGEIDEEVNVKLIVADEKPVKVSLNLDNTGTASTGTTHAGLVLQHANLWNLDHLASLQYTTTVEKPSQVAVWGAGYHIPLYRRGDSVDLIGSYSNVDSGTVAAGLVNLAVSGKGSVFGARYNQTLPKWNNLDSKLIYGADYKAFKNLVLYGGENFGNDVTVRPVSLTYTGNWQLQTGDANVSLSFTRNLPGGLKGRQEDFDKTRIGAPAGFSVMRFGAGWNRSFESDWQLRMQTSGQYARQALIPGEQFGAGGATSVRGFGERELANDNGLLFNAEVYTPNLCPTRETWQCRLMAFTDAAYASRIAALPGELESGSIASAGLGLRMLVGSAVNLQVDVGRVIKRGPTNGADKTKAHLRAGISY